MASSIGDSVTVDGRAGLIVAIEPHGDGQTLVTVCFNHDDHVISPPETEPPVYSDHCWDLHNVQHANVLPSELGVSAS